MVETGDLAQRSWCIVAADEVEGLWARASDDRLAPIQYQSPDGGRPLFQRAVIRATNVAPASQILVTALAEDRRYWDPFAWSVKGAHRFVCSHRALLPLASAAAILAVAASSPSAMVTILPARCYVAHEWIVRCALQRALAELPHTEEGVITLGMSDMEESYDENYLIVERRAWDGSLRVVGYARRPVRWVGAHLKRRGALVASNLLVGYASVLASHVSAMWPGISRQLIRLVSTAANTGAECVIPGNLARADSRLALSSIRWRPPGLPQRALLVRRSGWNGLCSPRAVAQLTDFYDGSLQEGDDSPARPDSSPATDFAATSRG